MLNRPDQNRRAAPSPLRRLLKKILQPRIAAVVGLSLLALIVGYLGYSLVDRMFLHPPVEPVRANDAKQRPIQVEVLNGSGEPGIGRHWTEYLRARGFDVVEVATYYADNIPASIVVDRRGSHDNAARVAYAAGIGDDHIIRHLNRDRYVDVSVIIGRDHASLKPSQSPPEVYR